MWISSKIVRPQSWTFLVHIDQRQCGNSGSQSASMNTLNCKQGSETHDGGSNISKFAQCDKVKAQDADSLNTIPDNLTLVGKRSDDTGSDDAYICPL